MLASSIPAKFPVPFAVSASAGNIRTVPQTTSDPDAASLTLGFPPATFQPVGSGGAPPNGEDFNGILNQITAWNQWQQAGGPIAYDATFSTEIGGYPNGALIASAVTQGLYFISTADNNTSNPDTGGSNWSAFSLLGGIAATGQIMVRPTNETSSSAPPTNPGTASANVIGWVRANGNTIGNASSGGTELASAAALNLFSWLWTNFSNSQCPVSSGRGASAAADFAAGKTITLLDLRGYSGVWGADTMGATAGAAGRYSSVTFATGNQNTAGSLFGANTSTLTSTNQMPPYTPSGSVSGSVGITGSTAGGTFGFNPGSDIGLISPTAPSPSFSGSFSGNAVGASSAISTAPRGIIGTIYLKL